MEYYSFILSHNHLNIGQTQPNTGSTPIYNIKPWGFVTTVIKILTSLIENQSESHVKPTIAEPARWVLPV